MLNISFAHESGAVTVRRVRVVADIPRRDPDQVPIIGNALQNRPSRILVRSDVNHHSVWLGSIVAGRHEHIERPASQVEIVVHHLRPGAVDDGGVLQRSKRDVALEAGSDWRRSREQGTTDEP
jgi:hypothetical protein